jgi:hypothetical protein
MLMSAPYLLIALEDLMAMVVMIAEAMPRLRKASCERWVR